MEKEIMSNQTQNETYIIRKLTRVSDGAIGIALNNVLHSWEGPTLKYPKEAGKKPEYYIYGIQYSKEKWLELKNGGEGLPFFKQSCTKLST